MDWEQGEKADGKDGNTFLHLCTLPRFGFGVQLESGACGLRLPAGS